MYKNIIYIRGNNSFAVTKEVTRWKEVFREKYGNENIESRDISDKSTLPSLRANLTITGLFADKRLFLLRGGMSGKGKKGQSGFDEFFEEIAPSIPEDHFVICSHISQKETDFITWLQKNAQIKELNSLWEETYWQSIYKEIKGEDIEFTLGCYKKSWQEGSDTSSLGYMIANTFELMELSGKHGKEGMNFIVTHEVVGDFDLMNAIQDTNHSKVLSLMKEQIEQRGAHATLAGIISQIRNTLYIKSLGHTGYTKDQITKTLPIHPYSRDKALRSKISYEAIEKIFTKLLILDRAYKSGRGLRDAEFGKTFFMEKLFLGLKK